MGGRTSPDTVPCRCIDDGPSRWARWLGAAWLDHRRQGYHPFAEHPVPRYRRKQVEFLYRTMLLQHPPIGNEDSTRLCQPVTREPGGGPHHGDGDGDGDGTDGGRWPMADGLDHGGGNTESRRGRPPFLFPGPIGPAISPSLSVSPTVAPLRCLPI